MGDERVASARLQGWAIHHALLARDVDSTVLNTPSGFDTRLHWRWPRRWREAVWQRPDLVVFQKVDSSRALKLARLFRRCGVRTLYAQSDPLPGPLYPWVDGVIASSEALADWLRERTSTAVHAIDEPLDLWPRAPTPVRERTHGLRAVFLGSAANAAALQPVRAALADPRRRDIELVVVSDHPEANLSWSVDNARRALGDADLGLLPVLDGEAARLKSANRLATLLSSGLPVVAGRLPSYARLLETGVPRIATTSAEWGAQIDSLRDPSLRRALGEAGRTHAIEQYAPERVGGRWLELIEQTIAAPAAPRSPERPE